MPECRFRKASSRHPMPTKAKKELRVLEEFIQHPAPLQRKTASRKTASVDMAPTPSVSSSSSSSLRKTFNGLPRELRDYIYELVYDEDLYVVLGRRPLRAEP